MVTISSTQLSIKTKQSLTRNDFILKNYVDSLQQSSPSICEANMEDFLGDAKLIAKDTLEVKIIADLLNLSPILMAKKMGIAKKYIANLKLDTQLATQQFEETLNNKSLQEDFWQTLKSYKKVLKEFKHKEQQIKYPLTLLKCCLEISNLKGHISIEEFEYILNIADTTNIPIKLTLEIIKDYLIYSLPIKKKITRQEYIKHMKKYNIGNFFMFHFSNKDSFKAVYDMIEERTELLNSLYKGK